MLSYAASLAIALLGPDRPWTQGPEFTPSPPRPPPRRARERKRVWHVSLSWTTSASVWGSVEGVGRGTGWSLDAPEFALGTVVWAYGMFMETMDAMWGGGVGEEGMGESAGSRWDWFGAIPAGVWTEGREVWGIGSFEESYHRDEQEGGDIVYVRVLIGTEVGWRWPKAKLSGVVGWSWHSMRFDNRGDEAGSGPFVGAHFDWIYSTHFSIGVRGDFHYWTDFMGDDNFTTCVSVPLVFRW